MCSGVNLVCICFYLRKISLNLPLCDHIWIQITGEGVEGIFVDHLGSGLSPEWLLSNWAHTEGISINLSNYWLFKRFVPQSLHSSWIEIPLALPTLVSVGFGGFCLLVCLFVCLFWVVVLFCFILHFLIHIFLSSYHSWQQRPKQPLKNRLYMNKLLAKFLSSGTNLADLMWLILFDISCLEEKHQIWAACLEFPIKKRKIGTPSVQFTRSQDKNLGQVRWIPPYNKSWRCWESTVIVLWELFWSQILL